MNNRAAMEIARNMISERKQSNSPSHATTTYYSQFWAAWDEAKAEGVNPTDYTNRLLDAGVVKTEPDRQRLYHHLTRRDRAIRKRQLEEFEARHRAHMKSKKGRKK